LKVSRLETLFVEAMPEVLVDGVLYISQKYRIALHSCCCGCGEEVSTPLGPTEFAFSLDGQGGVTLRPSIGNHDYPCGSHYLVTKGKVEWAGAMTRKEIELGRKRDRVLKRGASKKGKFKQLWVWLKKVFTQD
jgi:Family of unknown function (DUF6527)